MGVFNTKQCIIFNMGLSIVLSGARCTDFFPLCPDDTDEEETIDSGVDTNSDVDADTDADGDSDADTDPNVHSVDQTGSGHFMTIQSCINAAATGDTFNSSVSPIFVYRRLKVIPRPLKNKVIMNY